MYMFLNWGIIGIAPAFWFAVQQPCVQEMECDMSEKGTEKTEKADLYSRQYLEETLHKSIRRFQALVEYSSDIVLIISVDGVIRYCSPSVTRNLGYPSVDLIGQFMLDLTHNNDAAAVSATLENARERPGETVPEVEYRIKHNDGSWRTFSAKITNLLAEATVDGFLINSRDITERKQAEEALRESDERFRQVISSISDHIYVAEVQPDGRCINRYLSPNFKQLTGFDIERFMADYAFWVETLIHPGDTVKAEAQLAKLIAGQDSKTEYRLTSANGETIWVRDSAKVYQQGDKKMIYGVISDITDRKNLEEQLGQSQKLEAIGRLAGGVAHDFNNLLTIILGNAELSLAEVSAETQVAQDLQRIKQAAEHAAYLTRQLLAFSRSQSQEVQIFNLNIVVENMRHMLSSLLGEDIEFIVNLNADLYMVRADPTQLEHVIVNLVVNARDAIPQNGKVQLTTTNAVLTSPGNGCAPGQYVVLTVSDTGCGMDQDTLGHIFEPFFTTKGLGKGTGLGLASVHGIVTQSGGSITVDSVVGEGSTFKIYLPRYQPFASPELTEADKDKLRSSLVNILVVEDEDMVRELIARTLRDAGYNVMTTGDRQEALQIFRHDSLPIHLLLTDIVMPGQLNFQEFLTEVKARRQQVEILYISGYPTEVINQKIGNFSFTPLLKKPFSTIELLQAVQQKLETPF
jgi:two-component system cell cycle sensor histidine kinase/response regulator CckA